MNIEKLIQVVGYVLKKYDNHKENFTKIIKLIYLADRKSLEESGYSITEDSYVSMKNGPVLSGLYDLIKNRYKDKAVQYYWNSKFATENYDLLQICSFISTGELSKSDMDILDSVDKRFHSVPYPRMIDFVHDPRNCPEWKDTQSSIFLSESEILSHLGFSKEEIEYLEDEKKSYAAEKRMLDSISEYSNEQVVENA